MTSKEKTIDILYTMPVSAFVNGEKCHLKKIREDSVSEFGYIGLIDAVNQKWRLVHKKDASEQLYNSLEELTEDGWRID